MNTVHADAALFANEAWSVTSAGLEHRNGYFIARDEIGARRSDGLWLWPLQMAEKTWCAPQPFVEAFLRAALAFGAEGDAALARSLAVVRNGAGTVTTTEVGPMLVAASAEGIIRSARARFMGVEVERDVGGGEARRAA